MRTRPQFVRAVVMAVLLAIVAFAGGGCGGSVTDRMYSVAAPWVRDASGGISVSHPSSWRLSKFEESGSFVTGLLFFSNQAIASPCVTSAGGNTISCSGLPRATLHAGGLKIGWFDLMAILGGAMPGKDVLSRAAGQVTRIDGHQAKIAVTPASGACRQSGGTLAIDATIATTPNYLSMSACLSHPSNEQRQQVLQSLRSVRS
jgi:hypothetical protein